MIASLVSTLSAGSEPVVTGVLTAQLDKLHSDKSQFLQIPALKISLQQHGSLQQYTSQVVKSNNTHKILTELLKLTGSRSWGKLRTLAKNSLIKNEITLDDIEMVAAMKRSPFLLQAVNGARSLLKLGKKANFDASTAFSLALFLERIFVETIHNHGTYYFERNKFGIERDIQIDPITANAYIHLGIQSGTQTQKPLGEGSKKTVYKAVIYDSFNRTEMTAVALASADMKDTFTAWKALNQKPGLVSFFSILDVPSKNKKSDMQIAIFMPCFTPGGLTEVLAPENKLTFKEKVGIARDAMMGLRSVHENGYIHRNINDSNVLTRIRLVEGSRRVISALGGLSRAVAVADASRIVAQVSSSYLAPEAYAKDQLQGEAYFATDLFAMGEVYWHLFYGKRSSWSELRLYKDGKGSIASRKKKMIQALTEGLVKEKKQMKKLSIGEQQFLQIIMNLLSVEPNVRGTARMNYEQLDSLFKTL